jgi:subtilisin family serine protease
VQHQEKQMFFFHRLLFTIILCATPFLAPLPSHGQQQQTRDIIAQAVSGARLQASAELLTGLETAGAKADFIVMLRQPRNAQPADLATEEGKSQARAANAGILDAFLGRRQAVDIGTITRTFSYMPAFAVTATAAQLATLLGSDAVASVEENRILTAHLRQGIPLQNALSTRSRYAGAGIAVAVCDTGIDYTNPHLGGGSFPNAKVIGGYDTGQKKDNPMDGNGHGTACAGIIAGNLAEYGDYIGGVAPAAKLYALKISTDATGGSSDTAAMVDAWEWSITHQNDAPATPIRIISTSFGGGSHNTLCDATSDAMTTAAANAVAAGITIFVSSGNDGYCSSMGWPACISHVISVGAVYDANFGNYTPCVSVDSCLPDKIPTKECSFWYVNDATAADKVTAYSNSASFLTLFAPSNRAYTLQPLSKGTGPYDPSFGGTSAACPYAAGAAAALQSAAKSMTGSYLTPAQVRSTLTATGVSITDTKAAVTKPRVNLLAAIQSLGTIPTTTGGASLLPLGIPATIAKKAASTGFNELFLTNENKWTANSMGVWTIGGGTAVNAGSGSGRYRSLYRNDASYADLDYRVTMALSGSGTESAGYMFFRAVPTPEDSAGDIYSGYWFGYSQYGTFGIMKGSANTWTAIVPWTAHAAIVGNGQNELRAVASGTSLTFYINGIQVHSMTDSQQPWGRVGFGLYDKNNTLTVHQSSLTGTAVQGVNAVAAKDNEGTPASPGNGDIKIPQP